MKIDVRYSIGNLEVPKQEIVENIQKWQKEIEVYTIRLRETGESLNDEELSRTYHDGSWAVQQLVHHIADSKWNMFEAGFSR